LEWHPHDPSLGTRTQEFGKTVFIDRADFHDSGPQGDIPPPKVRPGNGRRVV